MYEVRLLEPAQDNLAKLDKRVAKRVVNKLFWLAENFESVRLEPLQANLAGFYKLRVGDYRAVYEVVDDEQVLIVHRVGHRRDVYKL